MKDSIQYIKDLDLKYLVLRLVEKQKWDLADAEENVRKYKNFLILRYKHPDFVAIPTLEIDEVWHNHILYTKDYTRDCDYIFGRYLHHSPSSGTKEEKKLMEERYTETMRLYESMFQESYAYALDMARW